LLDLIIIGALARAARRYGVRCIWFDRTKEYMRAVRTSPVRDAGDPILEASAVLEAAARARSGVQAAGPAAVLAHHPHTRPDKLKKGPAPLFHATTVEMRQFLYGL
jgi:hypothetical protein